jgi:hypothetical protein
MQLLHGVLVGDFQRGVRSDLLILLQMNGYDKRYLYPVKKLPSN